MFPEGEGSCGRQYQAQSQYKTLCFTHFQACKLGSCHRYLKLRSSSFECMFGVGKGKKSLIKTLLKSV